jgi:hypothetical protein
MALLAPHTRLTPTQALFWLRHCGAQIERVGGRWHLTWRGQQLNVDHAALCASAIDDRAQTLQAQSQHAGPLVVTALVACVGKKRTQATPAQELYLSPWFRKARAYAERYAERWCILSALYGLVAPDEITAPYNVTLTTMKMADRLAWAERVWPALLAAAPDPQRERIVVLAGDKYRQHLQEWLRIVGYDVEVPMLGLGIGEQLAWLDAANAVVTP